MLLTYFVVWIRIRYFLIRNNLYNLYIFRRTIVMDMLSQLIKIIREIFYLDVMDCLVS